MECAVIPNIAGSPFGEVFSVKQNQVQWISQEEVRIMRKRTHRPVINIKGFLSDILFFFIPSFRKAKGKGDCDEHYERAVWRNYGIFFGKK